jgi:hypothetical protein
VFSIPRVNVIESSEGFSVEVIGRRGLVYREGGMSIVIDAEVLDMVSDAALAVYVDSIAEWQESGAALADSEKKRVIENITKAFRFRNVEIRLL